MFRNEESGEVKLKFMFQENFYFTKEVKVIQCLRKTGIESSSKIRRFQDT